MPLYPPAGSGGSGAPTTSQYVTLALDGSLSAERVLTAGNDITITDGGANGNVTIARTQVERWGVVASDVSTVNTTTLADITGLALTISASATEIWKFEIQLLTVATTAVGDWKFAWTFPSGATMFWAPHNNTSAVASGFYDPNTNLAGNQIALLTQTSVPTYACAAVTGGFFFRGWIIGGGTGGAVQMQMASAAAGTVTLTAKKGSMMMSQKVVA